MRRGIDCSFGRSNRGRVSPTARHLVDSTDSDPIHNSDAIEKTPSRALIYIQVFFEKFHSTWPFLHRATFDPDHEPALLLQSVMMMGLWLTGKEDARIVATDLHSKLLVSIHQQRVSFALGLDTATSQIMNTLQSCLANTYKQAFCNLRTRL